jgi:hypothetical protein
MTQSKSYTSDPAAETAAVRAAGYCGADHPRSNAFCTRRPGHSGQHGSYYGPKQDPTDVFSVRWG